MSPGISTRNNGRGQVREGRVSVPAPRGIGVIARGLLAEPRARGNEAAWTMVKTKFPEEDQNLRSGSSGGSWGASVTEPEEVSGPTWRPLGEFNPQVAFEVIYSRNQEQSDGLRFSHLQSIIRTQFGQ